MNILKLKSGKKNLTENKKKKELEDNRRELRLQKKDLEKNQKIETLVDNNSNLSLGLENFDTDKNTKN